MNKLLLPALIALAPMSALADQTATVPAGKTYRMTCTEDTARPQKDENNSIASFDLVLHGDLVKISNAVFTDSGAQTLQQAITNEKDFLAKGLDYDGKTPLTDQEKAAAQSQIDKLELIQSKATGAGLSFEGQIKQYIRTPKRPTVQYPLSVTTPGVDENAFWDFVGNEGNGARFLMPPNMLDGDAGKSDIEWDGTQGPLWDRFDCK
jgi:hypothetical protein